MSRYVWAFTYMSYMSHMWVGVGTVSGCRCGGASLSPYYGHTGEVPREKWRLLFGFFAKRVFYWTKKFFFGPFTKPKKFF